MASKLVLITAAPGFSLIRANLKHIPPTHPPTTAQNQITIHLQMTFTCDKCSSLFPSRAALYSHNYDVHLEAVSVGSVTVRRKSDGCFKCPAHGSTGTRARFVRDHRKCFEDNLNFTDELESDIASSIDGDTLPAQGMTL